MQNDYSQHMRPQKHEATGATINTLWNHPDPRASDDQKAKFHAAMKQHHLHQHALIGKGPVANAHINAAWKHHGAMQQLGGAKTPPQAKKQQDGFIACSLAGQPDEAWRLAECKRAGDLIASKFTRTRIQGLKPTHKTSH